MARWIAIVAILVGAPAIQAPDRNVPPKGRVVVLLAEGRLQLIDVASGDKAVDFVASGVKRHALQYGRLARAEGTDEVFAILPDGTVPVLVSLNVGTGSARSVGRLKLDQFLARSSDQFWGLAVGQQTGWVYAFSHVDATVLVLNPKTAEVLTRFAAGSGETVMAGAVSPDERRIFVTYHGHATGIEAFDVEGGSSRPAFYVPSHGNFAQLENTLLATTGGPELIEINRAGETVRSRSSLLTQSHQMELALSRDRKTAYFTGSCSYGGGFSRLDMTPGATASVLVPSGDTSVCGERLSVSAGGTWVAIASVGFTNAIEGGSIPRTDRPGRILIVDAATGAILRDMPTTTDVVDVLAVK